MTSHAARRVARAAVRRSTLAAQAAPTVRGADWRTATVATVGADNTVTTVDGIPCRRMSTYTAPQVGDQVVISRSGAGNWLALGPLARTTDGVWTPYSVDWTASTTNPALGNGSLTGRYVLFGRTCHVAIELTTGSTTTYGSGPWSFSVPFAAAVGPARIGLAHAIAGSSSLRVAGHVVLSQNNSRFQPYFPASSSVSNLGSGGATNPAAWVSGNTFRADITYETA